MKLCGRCDQGQEFCGRECASISRRQSVREAGQRYQQTLQREWAYALEYASSEARRASLPHWVHHYNERRTHSALGNRTPLTRVRDVTGLNI